MSSISQRHEKMVSSVPSGRYGSNELKLEKETEKPTRTGPQHHHHHHHHHAFFSLQPPVHVHSLSSGGSTTTTTVDEDATAAATDGDRISASISSSPHRRIRIQEVPVGQQRKSLSPPTRRNLSDEMIIPHPNNGKDDEHSDSNDVTSGFGLSKISASQMPTSLILQQQQQQQQQQPQQQDLATTDSTALSAVEPSRHSDDAEDDENVVKDGPTLFRVSRIAASQMPQSLVVQQDSAADATSSSSAVEPRLSDPKIHLEDQPVAAVVDDTPALFSKISTSKLPQSLVMEQQQHDSGTESTTAAAVEPMISEPKIDCESVEVAPSQNPQLISSSSNNNTAVSRSGQARRIRPSSAYPKQNVKGDGRSTKSPAAMRSGKGADSLFTLRSIEEETNRVRARKESLSPDSRRNQDSAYNIKTRTSHRRHRRLGKSLSPMRTNNGPDVRRRLGKSLSPTRDNGGPEFILNEAFTEKLRDAKDDELATTTDATARRKGDNPREGALTRDEIAPKISDAEASKDSAYNIKTRTSRRNRRLGKSLSPMRTNKGPEGRHRLGKSLSPTRSGPEFVLDETFTKKLRDAKRSETDNDATSRTNRCSHQESHDETALLRNASGPEFTNNEESSKPHAVSSALLREQNRRQKEVEQGNSLPSADPSTMMPADEMNIQNDTKENDKSMLRVAAESTVSTMKCVGNQDEKTEPAITSDSIGQDEGGESRDVPTNRFRASRLNVIRREQRRLQKEADQGDDRPVLPGEASSLGFEPSAMTTASEIPATSAANESSTSNTANETSVQNRVQARRDRRLEKEADQGNDRAVDPRRSAVASPTNSGNEREVQISGLSDGGDAQPRNFRASRQLEYLNDATDSSSDEEEDDDFVPGAYCITTQGTALRPSRMHPIEVQQFSGSAFGSAVSEQSAGYSAKSGSSKEYSSSLTAQQEGQHTTTHIASPTSNDIEAAPVFPAPMESSTADTAGVEPDKVEDSPSWKRPLLCIVVCLCVLAVVAIAVAVPLALRDEEPSTPQPEKSTPTTSPTVTPTMAPTFSERAQNFIILLRQQSVSKASALLDPSQPQSMAVTWLADSDGAELNPVESEMDIILERYIMALLYYSWSPQFSGFMSDSGVCEWRSDLQDTGIFCEDGHVSRIQLNQQQLKGSIPSEIFLLPKLEEINLSLNQLTGTIPHEIGLCPTLRRIDIGLNTLSGTIPETIENLSNLENLFLWNNDLTGSVPTSVFHTTGLRQFTINSNTQIKGTIPTEIGLLTALEAFDIVNTGYESTIPTEIGTLSELRYLHLGRTMLSGTVPTEIGMLSHLIDLRLEFTWLDSTIPSEFGELRALTSLRFDSSYGMYGSIPENMKTLSSLTKLNLGYTELTDEEKVVESLCATNQPPRDEELEFSACDTAISCPCCNGYCN